MGWVKMRNEALRLLADWKFSVIPVGTDKKPLISWKEFQSRLPTPEEVRGWWTQFPDANLGIVTGSISDLLVVDLDDPAAMEAVEAFLPEGLMVPMVETPRGFHLYFRGERGIGNKVGVFSHVDVRSEGGYVVAPPSMGGVYKWDVPLVSADPPAVPPALLEKIKGTGWTGVDKGGQGWDHVGVVCPPPGPQEGRRDDALFHAALTMFKGGAEYREVEEAIASMAAACNPPFPRADALVKVRSAYERRRGGTAQEVKDWIAVRTGWFTRGELSTELNIPKGNDNLTKILQRLKAQGFIEPYGNRDGHYRLADQAPSFEDLATTQEEKEFPLRWPLKVEDLVVVSKKSVVVLAGETNAGKTAFMINFCDLNLDKYPIRYLSTETTAARFRSRIVNLSRPISEWSKVQFTDKVISDFHLHLNPAGINIIDYLEPDVEALWRISSTIQKIFDALTTGIAIVCVQKKKGIDYGYGGVFTAFKSELYLAMSAEDSNRGELKIIKGKNWRRSMCNPYLRKRSFYIQHGVQFHVDLKRPDWYLNDGDQEGDY